MALSRGLHFALACPGLGRSGLRMASRREPWDHSETMSITIQLLGRPGITRGSGDVYRFRSRKSWGLLAYLILSERPPARSQLASLLFPGADDPVRALRWGLAEIRRALGEEGAVDGDPVVLQLPAGAVVDVQVVIKGTWMDAVGLPGLGADLLEGMTVKGGAAFETWLLSQQRHAAAASEAILHDHWLAFLPWPQALLGEVRLGRADRDGAAELLQHAFARACRLGDPCWEGMAARGLALVAEAAGDTERAFGLLADARARCSRLADPYLWLDGYILDAQCELGRRHGHADTRVWVETMRNLASRTGMRELALHSLLHGAALGSEGDGVAAAVLADEIGLAG